MINFYKINLVMEAIGQERVRQEELRENRKFLWTCASPNIPHTSKLAVLAEEFGETAKEVVDYGISIEKYTAASMQFPKHRSLYFLKRIREELIQCAAVCVAWCETIDKEIESINSEV